MRSPCVRCGLLLDATAEKVLVGLTPDELAELACGTGDPRVRERLLCALGLLDAQRERDVRAEMIE
jgi:hypothetical protein